MFRVSPGVWSFKQRAETDRRPNQTDEDENPVVTPIYAVAYSP